MKSSLLFRTFSNTSAQIAGRLLSGVLAFLMTLFLAKNLGGEGYGEYTKILAYLAFFYILSDFGLNAIFLRDYGARLTSAFAAFLGLRLVGSAVLGLVAITLMMFVSRVVPGWSTVVPGVVIGSLSVVGFGLFMSVSALFQMRKRYDRIAVSQIAGAAAALGLLLILHKAFIFTTAQGILVAMFAVVTGWWVSAATGFILLKQPAFLIPRFDRQLWRNICLLSLPLGATLVLNIVYFRADTFILATYKTSLEVGAYGLAYKFFELALALPAFIMNSLYPEFLAADVSDKQIRTRFSYLWRIFLLLAVVVGVIVWVAAPLLAYVNADFVDSVVYLRLLSLSLPFFYLSSPLMWFYILLKQQGKLVIVYGVSLVFNIAANILWVPRFGAVAASIITGLTEALVLFLGLYFMRPQKT